MTHDDKIVEAVARAIEGEIDVVEMVSASPETVRRLKASRIARAAITAYQAEAWQPMVKPLQWREEEPDWWAAAALSWPSGYEAWMTPRGVVRLRMPGESKFSLFEGSLDEAKRAAEDDYESRIRACILPNPPASP